MYQHHWLTISTYVYKKKYLLSESVTLFNTTKKKKKKIVGNCKTVTQFFVGHLIQMCFPSKQPKTYENLIFLET